MLFWLSIARAEPTFVAKEPRVARLATQAWRAAVECAGTEARAAPKVLIELGDPGGGFAGRAHIKGDTTWTTRSRDGTILATRIEPGLGLHHIVLRNTKPETIAHEVAHAWSNAGPPALVEGGADLLAACVARLRPSLFGPPAHAATDEFVDLRAWENSDDEPLQRSATYEASYELFRFVATLVDERRLWRMGWTWDTFDAFLLREAGPTGAQLVAMLHAGAAAQRVALSDPDGDGVVTVREGALGTDPARWDTDDDGWWDGASAELMARGRPILQIGHPVCSGRRVGSQHTRVTVTGETLAGAPLDELVLVVDARRVGAGPAVMQPHASILMEAEMVGWGVVGGASLVPDDRCWSRGRWTVVVEGGLEGGLSAFLDALDRADAPAEALFGPGDPLLVLVGAPDSNVTVRTRRAEALARHVRVQWADDVDSAAAWVVAGDRLAGRPHGDDPALQAALARRLVDGAALPAAADTALVTAWTAAVDACPRKWHGILAGDCVPAGERLAGADEPQVAIASEEGENFAPVAPAPLVEPASDRRWTDGRWTVVAAPDCEAALAPFVAALQVVDVRADGFLDPPTHPLSVMLGDRRPQFTSVPSGWLEGADWEYVAAYAIAAARLDDAPVTEELPGDVGMYEALAQALVEHPRTAYLAAMSADDVAPWKLAVKACKGGWRSFARGQCVRP